ncbi:MAG: hypothetical protein IT198_16290 [Acidimicrobiia bacterium]|nr:hypothetical protein [Acidimicrobiia bacterium]
MGWTTGVRQKAVRWRRSVAACVAAGIVAGVVAGVAPEEPARAMPKDGNVAIQCTLAGALLPATMPAFTCPTSDGYFGKYLFPLINDNGSFDESLEATMMAVMAIGGRGQPMNNPPSTWSVKGAKYTVGLVKDADTDRGPVDYLKEAGAAACAATPGDIALIARLGYTLSSQGEDLALPGCDIIGIVEGSFNAANGAYGPDLNSTIWAINLIVAQQAEFADKELTRDFVSGTNTLEGGGWSSNGTDLDVVLTARAIMALLGLDEDPLTTAIDTGFDALAAAQNEDGGWSPSGEAPSCTLETSYVQGALRATVNGAGAPHTLYGKFTQGEFPTQASPPTATGNRMGIEWPLLWEGLTYENPGAWRVYVEEDWNGRFVTCWGVDEASDYATMSDDELKVTTPTSTAAYYAHFWDPILHVNDEPVGPGGTSDVPTGTPVTPAVAQPSVTG